jgi:hypothetical protein
VIATAALTATASCICQPLDVDVHIKAILHAYIGVKPSNASTVQRIMAWKYQQSLGWPAFGSRAYMGENVAGRCLEPFKCLLLAYLLLSDSHVTLLANAAVAAVAADAGSNVIAVHVTNTAGRLCG